MALIAIHIPDLAVFVLRILSPALVLLVTLSILPKRPAPPSSPSPITSVVVATRTPRRAVILSFLSLLGLAYFLDGITFVIYAVVNKTWPNHTGIEVAAVEGVAAFAGLAALGAWKDVQGVDVWNLKRISTSISAALLLEIAQVVLLAMSIHRPVTPLSIVRLCFPAFRVLVLLPLLAALQTPRVTYIPANGGEEDGATDSSLLLPAQDANTQSAGLAPLEAEVSKYGTFRVGRPLLPTPSGPTTRAPTPAPSSVRVPQPKPRKVRSEENKEEINPDPSWSELSERIKRISPYLWPSKSRSLQLVACVCIFLVAVGRLVNLFTPLALAEVVKILEGGSDASPWPYLGAYVGLKFLQATGGLSALRDTLWVPVMQYSDREMSQLSFNHLLNLSFAFHTRRKTGEILRILDRGAAINHTLEIILFNIIPTFIDIIIALGMFCWYFEWVLTVVIFFVMAAYVAASVILTKWRTKLRRQMNERDVITRGIHTDCLLNYETVKYFGGEEHEGARYQDAILKYQSLEYRVMVSLNVLNLVQNFIITLGLLVGSIIVALQVTRGDDKAYLFVFFITYLAQLYGPLNMLGYIYRSVNQSLVDTEKLLKLLSEPTDVNDKPGAPDLSVKDGQIEFDNVSFTYDSRTTALNGISFKVPKGSSVALVGESGSGKSTILRLLYRFYDLQEGQGRILIDGQDIREVTQASLRKAIGVVPQDSVLFNASVAYNIGYGKFGASPDEIEAAAKAAQMHDRIMSFPDGYETKVGERGVRLSGGEKQRVAIARTLLKNPPILLLDEATSALDTSTEKDIQKALQHLVEGRSSLSIAHRLSTIASADLILVLKDGQIIEQGTHAELLALDGVFASMWADQVSSSDAASSHKKDPVTGYSVDQDDEPEVKAEVDTIEDDAVVEQEVATAPELLNASNGHLPVEQLTDSPQPLVSDAQPSESVEEPTPAEDIKPTEKEAAPVAFPTSSETPVAFPSADGPEAVAFPTSDEAEPEEVPLSQPDTTTTPVAFPSGSDSPAPPPIAFPATKDTASERTPSIAGERTQSPPAVTFSNLATPPRSGTPDLGSSEQQDGKRRRTLSTQGIQRLARRISISGRRQGSSGSILADVVAGLKRENTSSSKDKQDESSARGEGSGVTREVSRDSPAGSIQSEVVKTKSKKDKKDKKDRRKSGL